MTLYHITKAKYVTSILKKGILPGYEKGISCNTKQTKVFLTNDVERILRTQTGNNWEKELAIIEVDNVNYKPHEYTSHKPSKFSDFEFVVDKIEPFEIKNIKYLTIENNNNTSK